MSICTRPRKINKLQFSEMGQIGIKLFIGNLDAALDQQFLELTEAELFRRPRPLRAQNQNESAPI